MEDTKKRINEMIGELKKERDELTLKLHLTKMEASEEWTKISSKLEKLEAKTKELGGATAEASQDIGAAAKRLSEEIRKGFKTITQRL